jgi:hypothetical protein
MGAVLPLREGHGDSPSCGRSPARWPRRSLLLGGLAAVLGGVLPAGFARGASPDEADTSAAARDDAIRALPLSDLTSETRRKLMAVVERPSIYRRLPHKSVACDPALYTFLIRNPEVVVSIWQLMGVASMTAERVGPYLWKGNDGAGTTCDVELVYGSDNLHVIYSDGFYEGALLKHKITGRCVLVLKSGYSERGDRKTYVASRMDLFVQIDNTGADVVARTLSPWVGKVADANFHESCLFAAKLSQTAEQNSSGVQRLSDKLTKVEPPVREEFSKIAAAVQQRAALREVGTATQRR